MTVPPDRKGEITGDVRQLNGVGRDRIAILRKESDRVVVEFHGDRFAFAVRVSDDDAVCVQAHDVLLVCGRLDAAVQFRIGDLIVGLYVYASTETIMKKALKQLGLHKFESKRVDTEEGDIVRIDRNGKITRSQFEPRIYRSKYSSWFDYDASTYYNIHEEILLEYCGCYGVDSTDVELLLDYGYTCDEIEAMLADHSLLQEALRDVKYMCGESLYENCCGAF